MVAPLVGAWIETTEFARVTALAQSHPSWVRGLKLIIRRIMNMTNRSHPSWVRGLKLYCLLNYLSLIGRTPRGCVD